MLEFEISAVLLAKLLMPLRGNTGSPGLQV